MTVTSRFPQRKSPDRRVRRRNKVMIREKGDAEKAAETAQAPGGARRRARRPVYLLAAFAAGRSLSAGGVTRTSVI